MNKSEKFWDIIANNFDKNEKDFKQIHIKTLESAKKYLNVNNVVLDYGCATGNVSIEIANNVKEIYGIDISSKMINEAKRKANELKIKNIDFTQSTIFDERFKKESFDVILAFNIILHLDDTQKIMQRINELLKQGGFLISVTSCMGEKKTFLSILLFFLIKIGILPNMRFFKISELEDSITNGNFQIVETESLNQSSMNYFIAAKKINRK